MALGEAGQRKDRGFLRGGREAETAKRRERESDVEKNRIEEPLKSLSRTLAEHVAKERNVNTLTPSLPHKS